MTRVQVDAAGQPDRRGAQPDAAASRRQPAADASTRRCRRPGEAALDSFSTAGRLRGDERPQRRDPRARLLAHLRPLDLHQAGDPASRPTSSSPRDTTGAPLTDRAIQGLYPTGSTFKPITAIAALESGVHDPDARRSSTAGSFTEGGITAAQRRRRRLRRAPAAAGAQGLLRRLLLQRRRRCSTATGGGAQQKWASELGIGHPTGIDLPGEVAGLLPTPGVAQRALQGGDQLTDRVRGPLTGDNVNLAVGQGDLQADPLQMAVAYAAIANGGDVVRPHVGLEVEDPSGRRGPGDRPGAAAPPRHQPGVPRRRSSTGIHMAAQAPGGTSYPVFGNYPIPIAGKTGHRAAARPGGPVLVHRAGAVPEPADRRRGDDRAGRVRRRVRGARWRGRSSTPTSTRTSRRPRRPAARSPSQGPIQPGSAPTSGRRGEPLLMVSDAYPRPLRRAPRRRRRARRPARARPAAPARRARADRLQPLHARR